MPAAVLVQLATSSGSNLRALLVCGYLRFYLAPIEKHQGLPIINNIWSAIHIVRIGDGNLSLFSCAVRDRPSSFTCHLSNISCAVLCFATSLYLNLFLLSLSRALTCRLPARRPVAWPPSIGRLGITHKRDGEARFLALLSNSRSSVIVFITASLWRSLPGKLAQQQQQQQSYLH